MLFTNFYLMQEKKIETWFVSPASTEYFGIKSTAPVSLCANLMKCSFKDVLKNVALDFMLLVLKLAVSLHNLSMEICHD